jgi:hypothetical protein
MMEDWICRQNIQRWRSQLATVRDERQRAVLIVLLAEEHEKLQRFAAEGRRHSGDASTAGVSS